MAPNISKSRWNRTRFYRGIGFTLIAVAGLVTVTRERILYLFTAESLQYFPEYHLQLLLLFSTIYLIYQWIKIHIDELELLENHFKNEFPYFPRSAFAIVVLLATILGTLGYFSYKIVIYCSLFVLFSIFDIWGNYYRNVTIKKALNLARSKKLSIEELNSLGAIEAYYIEKPHLQRSATVMFFSFVSLLLGISAELYPDHGVAKICQSLAYGIMSLNIIVSETLINIWRKQRDEVLDNNQT